MISWSIKKIPIKKLVPHSKNPRNLTKNQFKELKISIEKFGLIDKPIVTKEGQIIGGHQRIEILKKLGHEEAECFVSDVDLSQKQIDELNIRLNKNTGEWDYDILANEWEIPDLLEWGFSADELVGKFDIEETEKEKEKSKKKLKECPQCGHEF